MGATFSGVTISGGLTITPAPPPPPPGQQAYTTPGTYSFIVPTGITTVSAIAVGAGGGGSGDSGGLNGSGGAGGGLVYSNDWSVTPGETLTVTVGTGGTGGPGGGAGTTGGNTTIYRGDTLLIAAFGGERGTEASGNAQGGLGSFSVGTGTIIQGGSKGAGASQSGQPCGSSPRCGINGFFGDPGGGGTAIVSGATGSNGSNPSGSTGGNGGNYGGGGGVGNGNGGGNGAGGAVRFVWGDGRNYPNNAPDV